MLVNKGDNVFIHGGQMTPPAEVLSWLSGKDVTVHHLHLEGEHAEPMLSDPTIKKNNLFVGHNARHTITDNSGSYIPVSLSQIPRLFRDRTIDLDLAILQVAPADAYGHHSLGLSCDVAAQAAHSARRLILVVNDKVPSTSGVSVHNSTANFITYINNDLPTKGYVQADDQQDMIAQHVAANIADNSVIQMGIGLIASSLGDRLHGHKGLTVHSEMVTDSVIRLVDDGVVDYVSTSFAVGSEKLHRFLHKNDRVYFEAIDKINDFRTIAGFNKFCAVNNVVEVDLVGNSVCDSIKGRLISGIGGQHDFTHAAQYSELGNSFLCLKSKTSAGATRIVPRLSGAATIPKYLADFIVTEHGAVRLKGLNLHQRIKAMIDIAHPDDRPWLEYWANGMYQYKTNVFIRRDA